MNKLLAVVYVLANVADFGFTIHGVALTSFETESNPIARDILMGHGTSGLLLYKFGGVLFVLIMTVLLTRLDRISPWIGYIVPILFLLGIAISLLGAWSWIPILRHVSSVLTFVLFVV